MGEDANPDADESIGDGNRYAYLIFGAIAGLAVLGLVVGSRGDDDYDAPTAAATTTASTARLPYPHQVMPGDGHHNMGGADGKDWGVWESAGGAGPCSWSIRLTSPYTGAAVLREGESTGQRVRVSIQPTGDVSAFTGEVDGGRTIFMTHGCGAWTLVD